MKWYWPLLFAVLGTVSVVCLQDFCNDAICASIVSKCLLIKSCDCEKQDKANCTCCKDCQMCLSKLYHECCSCVEMCAAPDPEESFLKLSSLDSLSDPIPALFRVLTDEVDPLLRWTSVSYPVHYDTMYFKPGSHHFSNKHGSDIDSIKSTHRRRHGGDLVSEEFSRPNCTVAFMSQCMSINKCKASCKSMGAAEFRWFHEDGCCECIAETCIGHGLRDAQCRQCPPTEDEEENEEVEEYEYINEIEDGETEFEEINE